MQTTASDFKANWILDMNMSLLYIEVCQYIGKCWFNTQNIHRVITVATSAGWLENCKKYATIFKE